MRHREVTENLDSLICQQTLSLSHVPGPLLGAGDLVSHSSPGKGESCREA